MSSLEGPPLTHQHLTGFLALILRGRITDHKHSIGRRPQTAIRRKRKMTPTRFWRGTRQTKLQHHIAGTRLVDHRSKKQRPDDAVQHGVEIPRLTDWELGNFRIGPVANISSRASIARVMTSVVVTRFS